MKRRKLKKMAGGILNNLKSDKDVILKQTLAGKSIKCIKGTVRAKPDQDDAWFYHLIAQVDSYYDIGANVGYTALLGLLQDEKKVLLVDPNPLALSKALKNLALNNIGRNVHFWPAFVSDSKGEKIKFYTVGAGEAGSMYKSHAETAAAINAFYFVDSVSVDYLSSYYNEIPELIKVDVEGAELLVLKGSVNVAKEQKSMFFVEMHGLEEKSMLENATGVLEWCKENNYKAYYLKTHTQLIDPQEIAERGKCHLLLLAESMSYPKGLESINQRSEISFN